jgi:hypothetical protein
MRIAAISILTLASLTGCMSLHADLPEEVIRQHVAREEGLELAALCSLDGRSFSEGAVACMAGQRMTCDASGRWVGEEAC